MAKNWETEVRDLYAQGELNTLRAILAVIEKTPFSRAIKMSPRRFNRIIANPERFTFRDAYRIAAFLKGNEKATPADEIIVVNFIQTYSEELRDKAKNVTGKRKPR